MLHWISNLMNRFKSNRVFITDKRNNVNNIDHVRKNFMNEYDKAKRLYPNWGSDYINWKMPSITGKNCRMDRKQNPIVESFWQQMS